MAKALLTRFRPAPTRLAVISTCTEHYEVGDPDAEWPNNIISRRAVVYGSGRIARQGDPVRHAVDSSELERCRRLSAGAARVMAGVSVGMGSEDRGSFHPFFVAANADEAAPGKITAKVIRAAFGGTLFPPVTISVEPLAEAGRWWAELKASGSEEPEYLRPWRAMIQWFRGRREFVYTAFVRIGLYRDLSTLPRESYPEGTELTGSSLPRLALGLTRGGSLAGLFGVSVQT